MSYLVLNLSSPDNWVGFYQGSFETQRSPGNTTVIPIPEIIIPGSLSNHILAVSASSNTAKPHWRFAGFLNQRIELGLAAVGSPDTDAAKHKAWLDRLTLVIFPRLTPTYSLSFETPKWIQDIDLTIFKYVGPESDSTDNLVNQIINVELPRLESEMHNSS